MFDLSEELVDERSHTFIGHFVYHNCGLPPIWVSYKFSVWCLSKLKTAGISGRALADDDTMSLSIFSYSVEAQAGDDLNRE